MPDEYISREAAVKAANEWVSEACMAPVMRVSRLFDKLAKVPAADVAEVRHGRWFFKYPNGWACSRCGEWGLMIDNRGICKSSYCPNCGALMDKEDDK